MNSANAPQTTADLPQFAPLNGSGKRADSARPDACADPAGDSADRNQPADAAAGRDAAGRFTSGNGGRRLGCRNRATRIASKLIVGEARDIARRAVDLAKAGDPTCMRLVLSHLIPPTRQQSAERVKLDLPADATPAEQARAVVAAMTRGELSPDAGQQMLTAMSNAVRVIEAAELEERISRLEQAAGGAP